MSSHRLALWAALVTFAGCTATAPVPEDRFYQLDVATAAGVAAGPALTGGLKIDRVTADPLRSGRAILYSEINKPLELKRYRYDFWVDQPPEMVRRALLAYLRAAGIADFVQDGVQAPHPARYRLSVRLQRFEQRRDDMRADTEVDVELEATLDSVVSGSTLWSRVYRQRQAVHEPGMHGSARAMEAALATILEGLASDLGALEFSY